MKKVMFISSTGGHLSELMQLKSLFSDYDYSIVTEKTKSTTYLKNKYKNVHYLIHTTRSHMLSYIFLAPLNIIKSIYLYLKINPDYIISTGTHTAVTMIILGHFLGSKIIYIESFANVNDISMAGKMIYKKYADLFVVQWDKLLKKYPKSKYGGWIY